MSFSMTMLLGMGLVGLVAILAVVLIVSRR